MARRDNIKKCLATQAENISACTASTHNLMGRIHDTGRSVFSPQLFDQEIKKIRDDQLTLEECHNGIIASERMIDFGTEMKAMYQAAAKRNEKKNQVINKSVNAYDIIFVISIIQCYFFA